MRRSGPNRRRANQVQQDLAYGPVKLTDVAIGPFTGDQRSDYCRPRSPAQFGAALHDLAGAPSEPTVHRDADGVARVLILRPGTVDLLELAVAQPRPLLGPPMRRCSPGCCGCCVNWLWCTSSPEHKPEIAIQLSRSRRTVSARISMRLNAITSGSQLAVDEESSHGPVAVPPRARG